MNDPVPYTFPYAALAQLCSRRSSGELAIEHQYLWAFYIEIIKFYFLNNNNYYWKRDWDNAISRMRTEWNVTGYVCARDIGTRPSYNKWAWSIDHNKWSTQGRGEGAELETSIDRDLNTSTSEQYKLPYLPREEN